MKHIYLNLKNAEENIQTAVSILKKGGLVIFPSDTVYGLLVDAGNEKAVKKLIEFKSRPPGKAVSVFVSGLAMMENFAEISGKQQETLKKIIPGPFTVILKSKHKINRLLESEKGTLGLRVPKYEYVKKLIKKFAGPLTATSANLSSRPPHYSVKTLLSGLSEKKKKLIDLIVDVGDLPRNKPSTVIDFTEPAVKILRQGDVSFSKLEKYISKSAEETKKLARKIFSKEIDNINKPLVFIIEGELGVGKTVFVKGIGEKLGIKNIVSPTFVVYYEYWIKKSKLIHIDLYNIQDIEEFNHLGIEKLLNPGNILCFEWGEKAGEIYELLKNKAKIVHIRMKYINEKEREIKCEY